jgi:hypothetical protein
MLSCVGNRKEITGQARNDYIRDDAPKRTGMYSQRPPKVGAKLEEIVNRVHNDYLSPQ